MYDTVNLRLSNDKAGMNLFESVPRYLTNIFTTTNEDLNYISISGMLNGLKVKVTKNFANIDGNSLCKYWFKNNIQTMSRSDVKLAIERIGDELNLPIYKSNVTRFDVANNLIMKHPEELYIDNLEYLNGYERKPYHKSNGLYFEKNNNQLLFYNKIKEQESSGGSVPDYLKNAYIVRYELRFLKRLNRQFKGEQIIASDLYDEAFYLEVLKRWEAEYFKIQKSNSMLQEIPPTGSTKKYNEYLSSLWLNHIGLNKALKEIKGWQVRKEITKKQAYDLRKNIEALNQQKGLTTKKDLILELDSKVKQTVLLQR